MFCADQSSGKIFSACKEISKISQLDPYCHLIIIICKRENRDDPTVDTFTPLIQTPIEYVNEDDAVEYVKNMLSYKRIYKQIIENNYEDITPGV